MLGATFFGRVLALCEKAGIIARLVTALVLLIPLVACFMAINIILGCYAAILLGYGPPNWQTALNQAVPLVTLQDYLNESRDWLVKKTPKIDELLNRLHVPQPIVFVDVTAVDEEEVSSDEVSVEQAEEPPDISAEEPPNESESKQKTNAEIPVEHQEKIET